MNNILCIIDMQKDFTTGALGNERCEAAIGKIIDYINSSEKRFDEIIFTRDTHQANYMETQEGRKLPVPHCMEGSDGWEVVPEIVEAARAKTNIVLFIDKPTFGSTELEEHFDSMNANDPDMTITFMGVCTGICVISNVACTKAHCYEAKIQVVADCCACVTQQSHETALEAMKCFQIDII